VIIDVITPTYECSRTALALPGLSSFLSLYRRLLIFASSFARVHFSTSVFKLPDSWYLFLFSIIITLTTTHIVMSTGVTAVTRYDNSADVNRRHTRLKYFSRRFRLDFQTSRFLNPTSSLCIPTPLTSFSVVLIPALTELQRPLYCASFCEICAPLPTKLCLRMGLRKVAVCDSYFYVRRHLISATSTAGLNCCD